MPLFPAALRLSKKEVPTGAPPKTEFLIIWGLGKAPRQAKREVPPPGGISRF